MTDRTRISVVVPTYNRLDRLRRVLRALADQSLPAESIEVIVVSDGSSDGTERYFSEGDLPRQVIPVFQQNSGPAAARNNGVRHASAALVLFLDDDVIPSRTLVEEHLRAHADHPGVVVIGPMLTPDDHPMSPWVSWEQRMLYKQYEAMDAGRYTAKARQFYTGNTSVSRELFEVHGGFDETFRRAEDIEFAYRLADDGIEFHYCAEARGYHYAERSFAAWCGIAGEYGRNDIVFARYPGRDHLGAFLVRAFGERALPLRILNYLTVSFPVMRRATVASMTIAGRLAELARIPIVTRAALSVIHSVLYFGGMADELGGATQFRRLMQSDADVVDLAA
jgi:GT2 family glycosyltransferase